MMMMMMMMMMMKKKNNKVIISTNYLITEDLILEILSCLPPITLIRFKSVSKTWHSLISNPDFYRRHTALYQFHCSNRYRDNIDDDLHVLEEPSSPGILLRRSFYGGGWDNFNIVIHPHPPRLDHEQKNLALLLQNLNDYRPAPLKNETFRLADSCNGLLLYAHNFIRKEEEKEKEEIVFYVCNPITKDYIKLPDIDIIDKFEEVEQADRIAHIVFNPSFSLTYKVFTWVQCVKQSSSRSVSSHYGRRLLLLYVYSSEAKSWRRPSVSIPTIQFSLSCFIDFKAVLWHGVLHWTTFPGCITDNVLSLCYDIEKETVWTMEFPKMATGYTHRRLLYFGLCGERLLMIENHYQHDGFPSSFDVLEKQEQNGDENEDMWTVRYHVNFEEVDNDFYSKVITSRSIYGAASILDIYRTMRTKNKEEVVEEEEVMLMKVGLVGSERIHRIIFFNLTSNTFGNEKLHTVLPNTGIPNTGFLNYTDILQYKDTLFPP